VKVFILLIIFLEASIAETISTQSMSPTDLLSTDLTSTIQPYSRPCRDADQIQYTCPEVLEADQKQAKFSFTYNLLTMNVPQQTCIERFNLDSKLKRKSPDKLNDYLGRRVSKSDYNPKYFLNSCSSLHPSDHRKRNRDKNVLISMYHYRVAQLGQNGNKILNSINEIDQILGTNQSLDGIDCESSFNSLHRSACRRLKNCKNEAGKIKELSDLTYNTLTQIERLKKEKIKLERLLYELKQSTGNNSPGMLGVSSNYLMNMATFDGRKKALLDQIKLIDTTVDQMASATPWIRGQHFESVKKLLPKHIEEAPKVSEEVDPFLAEVLNEAKSAQIRNKITTALGKQLAENREILLNKYGRIHEYKNCLNNQGTCERHIEIRKELVPYDPYAKSIKVMPYLNLISCIDEENNKADSYNQFARTSSEIALGFAIGGAGGALRLAMLAAKFYKKGNQLKGTLSAATLGTSAALIKNNVDNLVLSCQSAHKNLQGMGTASSKVTCNQTSQLVNIPDYTSCIVNITTLVVGSGLALRGSSKELAALFQKTDNAIPLNLVSKGVKGSKEEIEKLSSKLEKITDKEREQLNSIIELRYTKAKSLEANDLNNLVSFSLTLSKKNRAKFYKALSEESSTSATRKFEKLLLDNVHLKEKLQNKLFNKYNKTMPKEQALTKSNKEASKRASHVLETRLGCRSRTISKQHIKAGETFSKVSISLGVAGTGIGYSLANFNEVKDLDWYSKLGYEVTMAYFLSKLGANIMKSPSTSLLGKYLKGNANSAVLSIIDVGIYGQIFGLSENVAKDSINRLKLNPEKQKALDQLNKYMDDKNIVEAFHDGIVNNYKNFILSSDKYADLGKGIDRVGDLQFNSPLTIEDLENPEIKQKIINATIAEMYNKERGWLDFGSKPMDRFMYDRGWNAAIGVPKAMALAIPMYYSLCMSSAYPVKGITAAVGIQTINQLWSGTAYYKNRENLINQ
jgi:hypothetical protein